MTLSIKSILVCLIILATTSDIHTKQIIKFGNSKTLLAVARDRIILMGRGVLLSQLPIMAYSLTSTQLEMSVYIQSGQHCDLAFTVGSHDSLGVRTIQQVSDNTVAFVWFFQMDKHSTKVAVLNMDHCKVNANFDLNLVATDNVVIVPFVNRFDVITSKNTRASYDVNGDLIGQQVSFTINSSTFSITAVSGRTPMKGFFLADPSRRALNLVDSNGKILKTLLIIPTGGVSDNEQSMYSICSFDTSFVEIYHFVHCFLFDQGGKLQWYNRATVPLEGLLEVKNLARDKLVFVAVSPGGKQLSVVEMEPNQVNTWLYSAEQEFEAVRLTEFNEKDRTFVLAYETLQTKQGVVTKYVLSQKYAFIP